MTTRTLTQSRTDTSMLGIAAAALFGLVLLTTAGFAQSTVLHDSAHDTRHSIAFPCH